MIKHAIYAGYVANRQTGWELVDGKHEAIISHDTYDINQRLLYGKRKRAGEVRQKFTLLKAWYYALTARSLFMCPPQRLVQEVSHLVATVPVLNVKVNINRLKLT